MFQPVLLYLSLGHGLIDTILVVARHSSRSAGHAEFKQVSLFPTPKTYPGAVYKMVGSKTVNVHAVVISRILIHPPEDGPDHVAAMT